MDECVEAAATASLGEIWCSADDVTNCQRQRQVDGVCVWLRINEVCLSVTDMLLAADCSPLLLCLHSQVICSWQGLRPIHNDVMSTTLTLSWHIGVWSSPQLEWWDSQVTSSSCVLQQLAWLTYMHGDRCVRLDVNQVPNATVGTDDRWTAIF